MKYVVDMQGFKQSAEDYILKELAITTLDDESEPLVFLFKPPYSFQRLSEQCKKENIWLQRNYHGICWSSGTFQYTEIGNILRAVLHDATKIFVRGPIWKEWLTRFKFKVDIINDSSFSSLKKTVTICLNHNGAYKNNCALHNVKLMKTYLYERELQHGMVGLVI